MTLFECTSLSMVTLARPPTQSSLKITNGSFQYAAPCLWNELPTDLREPRASSDTVSFTFTYHTWQLNFRDLPVAALHQGAPGQMTWLEDPPPWLMTWVELDDAMPWLRPVYWFASVIVLKENTSSSAIAERPCCRVGWAKIEDWNWETIFTDTIGLSSTTVTYLASKEPKSAKKRKITAILLFKVIQGHRGRYQ